MSPWVIFCAALAAGAEPSLTITAPQRGETWSAASQHHITWKADALPSMTWLEIACSLDDGKKWTVLAESAANTGRFLWKVPGTTAKECRIRISALGRGAVQSERFSIGPSQEVSDYRWAKVTDRAPFAPRDGAGAFVFAGKMWLLGGWNPTDKVRFPRICNNEVWSSRDGATWELVKPNTFLDRSFDATRDWEGRHTAGYVVFKGRLWIVGGDVNQGHYHDDVWNSADGKTWTLVNKGRKVPWGPRALHYTLVHRDRIWVLGGQTIPRFAPEEEVFYRDVWTSADGIDWEKLTPMEPCWSARGMIGGSVAFRDRIWVLGGGTYDTAKRPERDFRNDVWSSADGVRWQRHVEYAPWAARQYHDVAVFDNRMWVLEGYSKAGGNRNDVWYSADGVNWYEVPGTPWKPRHAASVFVHDQALWMVAGNNMESDVWKLASAAQPKP
jgi:hypothetical protein